MKIEKMSFEESITKLEEIVKELEDENISLEESMEKFEMGIKLSSNCLKKLNEAEGKIEELTRSEDGKLVTRELDLEKENK
ncbi:MAG: exodeoxyribonuclease VII small subunit [Actinobacteria bacterium]|jgi:exodeoxyribonuclease VII small subunit|nr:exodeoxyribonuclease VII small subunit [Actinomycetota bacterium]MBL7123674.1 exodeoxyribonuclease VII small subunit [Actinomycetota bacterium]MBM3702370.1 exodeoxyribonuclease VII small subunit [Actinomycetota bacterium]MDP3011433.1 exodeoxyribonuclease VII small subunit [Candidatus Hydromicrobium sp.]